MPTKRKIELAGRFRPQFLFTLDQIAFILQIPEQKIEDYVWVPGSKLPPRGKMQAVQFKTIYGETQVRVPENQLNEWANRTGYEAIALSL